MEQTILEKRILTRESLVFGPSLEKAAKSWGKMKNFASSSSSSSRDPHSNPDKEEICSFFRDMNSYKLDMSVIESSIAVCDDEIEEYKAHECETDNQISLAVENIKQLETELAQEKIVRECREECEAMAANVNQLASRSSMNKRGLEVDGNKKGALELIKLFSSKIEERYKQFSAAVDTIEAVQDSLAEDLKAQIDPSLVDADASDDEQGTRGDKRKRAREEETDTKSGEELFDEANGETGEDAETNAEDNINQESDVTVVVNS